MSELSNNKERIRLFTLIEVLVVVTIISILLTILLPVLKKAKEASSKISCLSNLKQIGTAQQLYVGDNNGYIRTKQLINTKVLYDKVIPYAARSNGVYVDRSINLNTLVSLNTGETHIPALFYFYLQRGGQVFYCPSDRRLNLRALGPSGGSPMSYSSNTYFRNNALKITKIKRPSGLVNFGEARFGITHWQIAPPDPTHVKCRINNSIHGGNVYSNDFHNLLWLDGHASTHSSREIDRNQLKWFND